MKFKKGDKVICTDGLVENGVDELIKGEMYTVGFVVNDYFLYIKELMGREYEGRSGGFSSWRFIKIDGLKKAIKRIEDEQRRK